MKNIHLWGWALLDALLLFLYVLGIGWLMSNGNRVLPVSDPLLGSAFFLMLFVLSALISGLLILGRPLAMYLGGAKKEAAMLLGLTVLWMFVIMAFLIGYMMAYSPRVELLRKPMY